jgi:hypothetical protein
MSVSVAAGSMLVVAMSLVSLLVTHVSGGLRTGTVRTTRSPRYVLGRRPAPRSAPTWDTSQHEQNSLEHPQARTSRRT